MNNETKKGIALCIIVGGMIVIASLVLYINRIIGGGVFSAFFCLGLSLFGTGCKDIYKYKNYPSRFQEAEIERHAERNVHLWNKAGNISFLFTLFALLILSGVLDDLGYDLPAKITCGLAILSYGVYLASHWYINKKL